jgi:hypothetical protein
MIRLRDHYFIAWLKVFKGYKVIFSKNGVLVNINKNEYEMVRKEYESSLKPLFKEIRQLVKELAEFSSNSKD